MNKLDWDENNESGWDPLTLGAWGPYFLFGNSNIVLFGRSLAISCVVAHHPGHQWVIFGTLGVNDRGVTHARREVIHALYALRASRFALGPHPSHTHTLKNETLCRATITTVTV